MVLGLNFEICKSIFEMEKHCSNGECRTETPFSVGNSGKRERLH
jgi:hypothetical protein